MKNKMTKMFIGMITLMTGIFFLGNCDHVFAAQYTDKEGQEVDTDTLTGWAANTDMPGEWYWFDAGVMAADKEVYDPETDAWYWFDADGTMAKDKDVFIPVQTSEDEDDSEVTGKWVRYDEDGLMIKGEDYRYGGWYDFDIITGEMVKGFTYLSDTENIKTTENDISKSDEDTKAGKWVYYDEITGQMHHGESYIDENWYRFDDNTGAMVHGEYANENGWYRYDDITGIMIHGEYANENGWYRYDDWTGIMVHGEYVNENGWYRYHDVTGVMIYGEYINENGRYRYDDTTGIMVHGAYTNENGRYRYDDITGTMILGSYENDEGSYYYDENTGAMRTGIVDIDGTRYKYDAETGKCLGEFADGVPRDIICWGDSMTQGVGAGPAYIIDGDSVQDISYRTYPSALEELTGISAYNRGVGGETSQEIMERALDYYEDYYETHEESQILILEIGSNGGWGNDYDTLIKQYRAMIESADTDYYIILGDTDDPGTSIGDKKQKATYDDGTYIGTDDTMWEAALREEFGEHFLNTRVYLIENGMSDCKLTPDKDDLHAQECGRIPTKLRFDWTHLNSYGYYSKALAVYQKGVELGYW